MLLISHLCFSQLQILLRPSGLFSPKAVKGGWLSGERAAEGLSRAVGYTLNVNGRVRMGKQAH